jgi:hypothetical protein
MELSKFAWKKINQRTGHKLQSSYLGLIRPPFPLFVWLRHTKSSTQFGLWNRANKNTQCIKWVCDLFYKSLRESSKAKLKSRFINCRFSVI